MVLNRRLWTIFLKSPRLLAFGFRIWLPDSDLDKLGTTISKLALWLSDVESLGRSGLPVGRYIAYVNKTVTKEGRITGNGDVRLIQLGMNARK